MWREAARDGVFRGAPIDLADGYIHFSTAAQVAETAARHFAGATDLVLVAVDAAALGDALRWEPSRGGALFPHLYGTLPLSAVHSRRSAAARCRTAATCFRSLRRDSRWSTVSRCRSPALLDPESAHRLALTGAEAPAAAARRRRRQARGLRVSACAFPIRSGLPPASTRTPRRWMRCCASASASPRSAP